MSTHLESTYYAACGTASDAREALRRLRSPGSPMYAERKRACDEADAALDAATEAYMPGHIQQLADSRDLKAARFSALRADGFDGFCMNAGDVTRADVLLAAAEADRIASQRAGEEAHVTALARSFANVEELDPEWVIDGFIPAATVTLIAGPGGTGKSLAAASWAATVSRRSNVLIASLEDSPEFSLKARLREAGADLARVFDMSEADGRPFDITKDIQRLYMIAADLAPELLIIDTLSACSPVSLTAVVSVRNRIMNPLLAFARQTGCAVALIHHVTKSGEIAGSQALTDSVRQVLSIGRDEQDPRVRVVSVHKTNLSAEKSEARFTIAEGPKAEWLDSSTIKSSPSGEATSRDKILASLKTSQSPVTAQSVTASTGLNYGAVRVALHRMMKAGLVRSEGVNAYSAA
jgi:predicted ATP-dependent serine protease